MIMEKRTFFFMVTAFSVMVVLARCKEMLHPKTLLTSRRFDIIAAYIRSKYSGFGVGSLWAEQLYQACCSCFTDAHKLLGECEREIIKTEQDVPYAIIPDKEHNIGVALALDKHIVVDNGLLNSFMLKDYSFRFFRSQHLKEEYLDRIAYEYACLVSHTYIVTLFPRARSQDKAVREILTSQGVIAYEKEVLVTKKGAHNLIKLFYEEESWFKEGNADSCGKTRACFGQLSEGGTAKVFIFLWECDSLCRVRECKYKIRKLFHIGNDSVHINDTHEQTIRYAQTLFNSNSLHHLNHASNTHQTCKTLLCQYKHWIAANAIDGDTVCLSSHATFAAYGLCELYRLPVIHQNLEASLAKVEDICIKNYNDHHPNTAQILFDPSYHFYYQGVKFASLSVAKESKKQCRSKIKNNDYSN